MEIQNKNKNKEKNSLSSYLSISSEVLVVCESEVF